MPHIIVNIRSGTSEQKKRQLTDAVVKNVVHAIGCAVASVSVDIREIDPKEWKQAVYDPLIQDSDARLYKKPGYEL